MPRALQRYLTEAILPSAWYPESDYNGLIQALAAGMDRKVPGGDVWWYFGRVGAQRDIAGEQGEVPERSHVKTAGVYRKFRDNQPHDVAGLFQRSSRLWGMYHDTGRITIHRAAEDSFTVLMRLLNFHFPASGLIEMQTAFLVEYARLLGFRLDARLTRCMTDGDLLCEWRCSVERSALYVASLAVLPAEAC